jgi:hypothetical protein
MHNGKKYAIMNADKVLSLDKFYTCQTCDTEKPETHFRRDIHAKPGHRYTCWVCEEYRKHKRDCRERKLETTLTSEEFYDIKSRPCPYCEGATWTNEELKMNGIDRFDNDHGYHKWNCEPCCYTCNKFKSDKSVHFITNFAKNFNRVVERRNQDRALTSQHLSEQSSDMKNLDQSPCTDPPTESKI